MKATIMRNLRWAPLLGFALLGVWATVFAGRPTAETKVESAPSEATPKQPPFDVQAIDTQLDALRKRTHQLELKAALRSADEALSKAEPQPKPAAPPQEPETPGQALQRERTDFSNYFAQLDRAREVERPDARWEQEIANRLSGLARQGLGVDSAIKDIRCGTTLCRIEVTHTSAQAQRMFSRDITVAVQGMTSIQWLDNSSVVYVARDGTSLPDWPSKS